ncbi:MAG: DedA family protein [Pseudonocardiaceae bacterium]
MPVPGETILLAAAVYAGAGRLNIVAVGIIAFLGAVIGDNLGYAIGHFGGRRLVLRFGRYLFITEQRLTTAEGFVNRHGGKMVTVARFIEVLRQANGIVAGLATMPWRRFLAFNALGAALWVGLWTTVGYFAGNHVDALYAQGRRYELYLGSAIVVLILAVILHHTGWQRFRHRRPDSDRPPS